MVYPLRSPLISSKLCPFFILATWIVAMALISPYLFAYKLVQYTERFVFELHWSEVVGESSYFDNYTVSILVPYHFIPLVLIAIIYPQQRERNVLKMAIAIVFVVCWLLSYWEYFRLVELKKTLLNRLTFVFLILVTRRLKRRHLR